jgi:hypothetical protein
MSDNPFSRDYKPKLDLTDAARSVTASRRLSKQRDERLTDPDPIKRQAARGTIPGLTDKDPVSQWERVKIIRKPSGL